jgi:hypothetical protein
MSKLSFIIHHQFEAYRDEILPHIKEDSAVNHQDSSHQKIELKELTLVASEFKNKHFWSRLKSVLTRSSPAEDYYYECNFLNDNGIDTHTPAAFANYYQHGAIAKSVFYRTYKPLQKANELFAMEQDVEDEAFMDYARFLYKLHSLGIFCEDAGIESVRYLKKDQSYQFHLVHKNRLNEDAYTYRHIIHHINNLQMPSPYMGRLWDAYLKVSQADETLTFEKMVLHKALEKWCSKRFPKVTVKQAVVA